jgi:hypothetical protein
MAASLVQELYNSPNGDRWTLCRNAAEKLVVCHQPNQGSGGHASETDVNVFLSFGGHGPEYQALKKALEVYGKGTRTQAAKAEFSVEAANELCRALGHGVAQCWSTLPQEIQHKLFETTVTAEGEAIRQQLALYLHGKHERTFNVAQSRMVLEPDSLGG